MKKYKITVNGQQYDVAVEELGSSAAVPAPAVSAPARVSQSPVAAAPTPVASAPTSVSSGPVGANCVKAPMPGTIISLKVSQGQAVKRGDVLLILEAMKMENEICATTDGTIAAIRVQAGSSVSTGDPMVDIA